MRRHFEQRMGMERLIEKASRNNDGKMHNLLTPFDNIPEAEKVKDDY